MFGIMHEQMVQTITHRSNRGVLTFRRTVDASGLVTLKSRERGEDGYQSTVVLYGQEAEDAWDDVRNAYGI